MARSNPHQVVENVLYDEVATGELGGETSATACPDIRGGLVMFKACSANTGDVYIGTSASATVKDGTTDVTTGFELAAGETTPWLPVTNLNIFHYICDGTGDDITYIVLR